MFFHIEASDVPFSQHQGFIGETSMNYQSNNHESSMKNKLRLRTCSIGEFTAKTTICSNLIISNQIEQKHLTKISIEKQKSNNSSFG